MTTDLDREWFRRNPQANMRLRRPGQGEVEELVRTLHPGAGYELASMGGTFAPPTPQHEFWVATINAGDALVRLLTVRDKGAALMPSNQVAVYAIAVGNRVPVSTRSA